MDVSLDVEMGRWGFDGIERGWEGKGGGREE